MSRPIVFSGPSLLQTDRDAFDLDHQPPAQQGDILRAIEKQPQAIGLIDGFFGTTLSVHQKEILDAMAAGIPVFGAASMGALRAAELCPFGMIGIGGIFEDYLSGALVSDAEVAISHGPEALGFVATTISLVDVRATVDALRECGRLPVAELDLVLDVAVRLHFSERTWEMIASECESAGAISFDVAEIFSKRHVERKRQDALRLMECISAGEYVKGPVPEPAPKTRAYREIRRRALGTEE